MADWWSSYQEEKKKVVALENLIESLGSMAERNNALAVTSEEDLVLVQEHITVMAKIESRQKILVSMAPASIHLLAVAVGAVIGLIMGLLI